MDRSSAVRVRGTMTAGLQYRLVVWCFFSLFHKSVELMTWRTGFNYRNPLKSCTGTHSTVSLCSCSLMIDAFLEKNNAHSNFMWKIIHMYFFNVY